MPFLLTSVSLLAVSLSLFAQDKPPHGNCVDFEKAPIPPSELPTTQDRIKLLSHRS